MRMETSYKDSDDLQSDNKMALTINIAQAFSVLLVAASLLGVSQAKTVVVGGNEKWRSGFNYTEWAFQNNPLYINDKLVFKYQPPSESSSAVDLYWMPDLYSYMTCDFSRATLLADATQGSGAGFTVALDQWRPYYFASGPSNGLNCKDGMKFFAVPWPRCFFFFLFHDGNEKIKNNRRPPSCRRQWHEDNCPLPDDFDSHPSLSSMECQREKRSTISIGRESGGSAEGGGIEEVDGGGCRVSDVDLVVDLPLRGGDFTWSNNRVGGSWARLDRFLVSHIILSWFTDLTQTKLPRTVSDHCPIILGVTTVNWGPKPFRFDNIWLEDKDLMEEVRKEWVDSKQGGTSSRKLLSKMGSARSKIKSWVVSKVKDRLTTKSLEDRLAKIDDRATSHGWSDMLRNERLEVVTELWKTIRREEQQWRQKSRVKWLLEGDRNIKFFHCVASGRRRNNFIENIAFDGVVKSRPDEVRAGVADFFEKHYKNVSWTRPYIKGLPLKKLSAEEGESLEEIFTEEEVWTALTSCDGNKAPGPDGFNLNFIKDNWKVISGDFMKFMQDFHRNGSIVKDLNKSFIALIPKCVKPKTMKDFRPICLVGALYKVLGKVLANRMRKVMNSVIGEYQMAFVWNRQIIDSFVIAEEIIHHWKKSKEGGLMVKLDFEKAYDSLDHTFLDNMLCEIGFGWKWRQWISSCISSPVLSVLVNGSPSRQFGIHRGLRQGDPLSPFLFNVAVEGLSALFKRAEDMDLMRGVTFGGGTIHVSHLQFVDDTMLFIQPRTDYLKNAKRILRCFEVASGLYINFHKSCVVKIGKCGDGTENWAAIVKCAKASLPISYLGLPLGGRQCLTLFWAELVQRIRNRMALWKRMFLNKWGRLVLIKAIMSSIPNYYMSVFKMPVWRFGKKDSTLWKKVLCAKYTVSLSSLHWNLKGGPSSSFFVKVVGGLLEEGKQSAKILGEGMRVVIGRGDRASLESIKVHESFPDTIGWSYGTDGQFSVKSFRKELESGQPGEPWGCKGIWKRFCPSKIEIFVWHLLQGRVSVKKVLQSFGQLFMDSMECPLCGEFEEDIDHLFLQCKWTWNLWKICMSWWGMSSCSSDTVRNWWIGWIGLWPKRKYERAWISVFFAVTWTTWEIRNAKVFTEAEASLPKAMDLVRFRVAWWFKNLGKGSNDPITFILLDIAERCIDSSKVKIPKVEKWMHPPPEVLKFNVDGAARGSMGKAGIGGVLRDHTGRVLCTFSKFIGNTDAITAEMQAIATACDISASKPELEGKRIVFVSDSQTAVSWINSSGFGNVEHSKTIYDIRCLLCKLGQASVEFNPRDTNFSADRLAKQGEEGGGDVMRWSCLEAC
ncbi:hypothetical protein Dsin_003349 [Dipteronia sinensis]|uniref:Uncharacterized protein n=1 Tax=Dipteronia sinensis TaxID=43782 RepID=A0AAE0B8S6_9ROSI|nr:hypothetical protein Dsin_003349 [Dipteronia sinensis]